MAPKPHLHTMFLDGVFGSGKDGIKFSEHRGVSQDILIVPSLGSTIVIYYADGKLPSGNVIRAVCPPFSAPVQEGATLRSVCLSVTHKKPYAEFKSAAIAGYLNAMKKTELNELEYLIWTSMEYSLQYGPYGAGTSHNVDGRVPATDQAMWIEQNFVTQFDPALGVPDASPGPGVAPDTIFRNIVSFAGPGRINQILQPINRDLKGVNVEIVGANGQPCGVNVFGASLVGWLGAQYVRVPLSLKDGAWTVTDGIQIKTAQVELLFDILGGWHQCDVTITAVP